RQPSRQPPHPCGLEARSLDRLDRAPSALPGLVAGPFRVPCLLAVTGQIHLSPPSNGATGGGRPLWAGRSPLAGLGERATDIAVAPARVDPVETVARIMRREDSRSSLRCRSVRQEGGEAAQRALCGAALGREGARR